MLVGRYQALSPSKNGSGKLQVFPGCLDFSPGLCHRCRRFTHEDLALESFNCPRFRIFTLPSALDDLLFRHAVLYSGSQRRASVPAMTVPGGICLDLDQIHRQPEQFASLLAQRTRHLVIVGGGRCCVPFYGMHRCPGDTLLKGVRDSFSFSPLCKEFVQLAHRVTFNNADTRQY